MNLTVDKRSVPGIRDNVFKSNPVLNWLNNGKNKIRKRGGASLSHGILYGSNDTAQSYQRYEQLNVTPQDGLTRDQYAWAQYAVTLTVDGFTERVAKAGSSAIEDIVEAKKMQAEEALKISNIADKARGPGSGATVWDMAARFGVAVTGVSWEMLANAQHKPIVIVRKKPG